MTSRPFAADYSDQPYWLTSLAPERRPEIPLPDRADVVVVGAGLAGLTVGHDLAAAGRSVVVLDSQDPGAGASSRNAGMLGRNTKHSFLGLAAGAGRGAATTWFGDLQTVFNSALHRIETEGLDCGYQQTGRLFVASRAAQLEGLRREFGARAEALGESSTVLDRAALTDEIGSERFVGGVVIHDNAMVHAGRYTRAFLSRAIAKGAQVLGNCPVNALRHDGVGFTLQTGRGQIRARDVVVCTNGHTGGLVPWLRRRVLQLDSYFAVTEPLAPGLAADLLRRNRSAMDVTRRPFTMRMSSDGTRLMFGGRTAEPASRLDRVAGLLHADMLGIFPQLSGVRFSNVWGGRCAVTWDYFPHVGKVDGVHYALGFNFSGLAMAPYLGEMAARQVLGVTEETAFHKRAFPSVLYPARAFDAAATRQVVRYYGWRDHRALPQSA